MLYRMFKEGFVILLTLLLISFGKIGTTSDAATEKDDTSAISSLRNEYASAWKSGDAEHVTRLYANDGVVLYPYREAVIGQSAIRTYFADFFNQFTQNNFELHSDEVKIAGNWAFDRGTYVVSMTPKKGGEAIEDNGKYLVILQRQADGSWKVSRDMDNSSRPLP